MAECFRDALAGAAASTTIGDGISPVIVGAFLSPYAWKRPSRGTAAAMQMWRPAVLALSAVMLRRRGSSQSEPIGAAHTATGVEGWSTPEEPIWSR